MRGRLLACSFSRQRGLAAALRSGGQHCLCADDCFVLPPANGCGRGGSSGGRRRQDVAQGLLCQPGDMPGARRWGGEAQSGGKRRRKFACAVQAALDGWRAATQALSLYLWHSAYLKETFCMPASTSSWQLQLFGDLLKAACLQTSLLRKSYL